LRHGAGKAKWSGMSAPLRLDRSLIRVSGPEARGFLDNVLTQDLEGLDAAGVLYGALLSPQGKVLADMLLWAEADGGVLIDADPARGAELLRRLSMYKLRADAALEDVSAAHAVLVSEAPFEGALPDPRLAAIGWRKIGARGAATDGASAYDAHRIALGVPDLARDAAADEVFAGEALLEELNGVDFQKGCFVGQENVSRMKRRATTRKKFCPIVFEGEAPAPGTLVMAGAAELGSVRSGVAGRALALIRLDRAVSATAPLTADGRPVRLDPPDWLILPQRDHG
jgi:folate-binding protein YgfZ